MPEPTDYSAQLIERDAGLAAQLASEARRLAAAASPAAQPARAEVLDLAAHWLADVAADAARAKLLPVASAASRLRELLSDPASAPLAAEPACLTLLADGLAQIADLLRSSANPPAPADTPASPSPPTLAADTATSAVAPAEPATVPAHQAPAPTDDEFLSADAVLALAPPTPPRLEVELITAFPSDPTLDAPPEASASASSEASASPEASAPPAVITAEQAEPALSASTTPESIAPAAPAAPDAAPAEAAEAASFVDADAGFLAPDQPAADGESRPAALPPAPLDTLDPAPRPDDFADPGLTFPLAASEPALPIATAAPLDVLTADLSAADPPSDAPPPADSSAAPEPAAPEVPPEPVLSAPAAPEAAPTPVLDVASSLEPDAVAEPPEPSAPPPSESEFLDQTFPTPSPLDTSAQDGPPVAQACEQLAAAAAQLLALAALNPPVSSLADAPTDAAASPAPATLPEPPASEHPQPLAASNASPDALIVSDPAASAAADASTPEPVADLAPPPEPADLSIAGELTPEQIAALMGGDAAAPAWGSFPLALEPARVEALQFVVAELATSLDLLDQAIKQFSAFSTREESTVAIREVIASLDKLVIGFEFASVRVLRDLLTAVADSALTVPDALIPEITIRLAAAHTLILQHVRGLEVGMEMRWPLDTFKERVDILLSGRPLHADLVGWHQNDPDRLLELDLVSEGVNTPPRPESSVGSIEQLHAAGTGSASTAQSAKDATATVRVPATVLESLVAMSSQLVLAKNRLVKLSGQLRASAVGDPRVDELAAATDELAQLSASMQTAMMRARMQPITRLFERYPRVVRDVANLMDKTVELQIAGESTQVDKTIFEGLGEPLTHILRDLVARWIQTPADRQATGLPPSATIKLDAKHLGNQVAVTITHDGYAPDPEPLLDRALAAGVITEEQAARMTPAEVFALAYDPTVADPEQAVVTRALAALRGRAGLTMSDGWTTIELILPLELAIIEAVLVAVSDEIYAVPLRHVQEIVKIETADVRTVRNRPVMTLRDAVLPLLDVKRLVGLDAPGADLRRFGIIVSAGGDPAALLVDRIVGRQEVVIKPLDHVGRADAGLFAGATIRDDGEVSLVFETERVLAAGADLR